MLKIQTKQVISVQDWDDLVVKTYGRPYSFQQQDGCKDRGNVSITIPAPDEDYENDSVPEEINGNDVGVSFAAWLARDPKQWNGQDKEIYYIDLFWTRNFYPDIQTVANDLHAKGLVPAGTYDIEIDW